MMINSEKVENPPLFKKKELPKKIKETVIPPKKEQIDIERVKYFLKHIITAHVKVSEKNKAKNELKDHLIKLRNVPGIGKTERVEEALKKLENKINNAINKEKELMTENKYGVAKIKSLTREIEFLKLRMKKGGLRKNMQQKPKRKMKDIKSILQLEKQIKKLEIIHKKFKKFKKHPKEAKLIQSKLKILRDRLKKAKS